ncbi:unnamed protein product [Cutaneotrichosporon oleaginosum]
MPYISPKQVASARAAAEIAHLASSLENSKLEPTASTSAEPSSETDKEPPAEAPDSESVQAAEATEDAPTSSPTDASPLTSSRSHTPEMPSLISCGTDSSNSLHTLSSIASDDAEDTAEIVEPEDDVVVVEDEIVDDVLVKTPEMVQYHRDVIAFTKPLYDRAKMVVERKLRVQRARGVAC